MALDILGNELYPGDVAVYADVIEGVPSLIMYEVEELVDNNVVLATVMSGEGIGLGIPFYLQDTDKRALFVRNPYKAAGIKRSTTLN